MMTTWVRAGRHDLCLDDVAMVKRHSDGSATIYLRRVREVALTAASAAAFLPRFGRFAGLDGDESAGD
jgi:hypothetical protein